MTNSVAFLINKKIYDENNTIIEDVNFTINNDYSERNRQEYTIPSVNEYKIISFGVVDKTTIAILNCDQELTIKLNGSTTEITATNYLFKGELTSLDVKNTTGNIANLTIELFKE